MIPRLFVLLGLLTFGSLSLPAAQPTPYIYKKVEDRELRLTVENPPDWKAEDKRPAMVFFHGGGWVGGLPKQFDEHCKYLTTRGLVCIQVQYRLLKGTPNDTPPLVCVYDAKSAMRWVRSHAAELGIDPQRIGAGGGSAGGHLAAFVGMVDGLDDPQDDLTVSPKANALALFNPVFDNGPENGWGTGRVKDRFKEFSPAHNISSDDPPAIIFLGTKDNLIPVSVVERFKANMDKAGVRCETVFYEGQGHGFFNAKADDKPKSKKKPKKEAAAAGRNYFQETLLATDKFLTSLGWLQGEPTLKVEAPE